MKLDNSQVEKVFNSNFSESYKTVLIGGFSEPEYLPFDSDALARIQYRADYVRSALHEAAHWCLAGEKRRQLPDYGYWYSADDRDQIQQQKFFDAEVQPQALEWIISSAAGVGFKPSVDNLSLDEQSMQNMQAGFVSQMKSQALSYLNGGLKSGDLAERALVFVNALLEASGESLVSKLDIKEAKF